MHNANPITTKEIFRTLFDSKNRIEEKKNGYIQNVQNMTQL